LKPITVSSEDYIKMNQSQDSHLQSSILDEQAEADLEDLLQARLEWK
jgi:hypothetical protein